MKVEERIFGGECRGGCLHKSGPENEGAATILKVLNVLSNFERKRLFLTKLLDGQRV